MSDPIVPISEGHEHYADIRRFWESEGMPRRFDWSGQEYLATGGGTRFVPIRAAKKGMDYYGSTSVKGQGTRK